MSDTPTLLIITAIPNPDKMEQLQSYLSQIMPILLSGGGKPLGRYRIAEQLMGTGGPKMVVMLEYPSAQAIKDMLAGDAFNALNELREEVFLRLDLMIGTTM